MSFKEVLAGKRKSPTAIFHKFRTDASIYERRHVFVEGYEDVVFYSKHADLPESRSAKFHICFGKKNLDKVADLYWQSDIENALISFIRDSDFDVFLGKAPVGKNFFVTCGYAVENYICSPEAVKSFLRTIFCLDEEELDLDREVSEYIEYVHRFHLWLSPIYGAAMYAKSKGRMVDLNQLKTEAHIKALIAGDDLPASSTLNDNEKIGLQPSDFNDESAGIGADFAQLPALRWLRGKYLLVVASVFLRMKEEVYRDKYKTGAISQFNKKASSNLSEEAVQDKLVSVATPTHRLNDFLVNGAICPVGLA